MHNYGWFQCQQGRYDEAQASFKRALNAHLKIVFGTDIGGMAWTESIAREFPRMVEFGMSPMDAIQAATSRPAEMLDMKGEIGVVAAGAYAHRKRGGQAARCCQPA